MQVIKRAMKYIVMIATVLLVLVGCGGGQSTGDSNSTNTTTQTSEQSSQEATSESESQADSSAEEAEDEAADEEEGTADETGDPDKLSVITTSEAYQPFFDQFTEETGIEVEFLSMSSGEVLSRIQAEGEAVADLWFGGGLDAFMAAKEEDLLEPHMSEAVEQIPVGYRDPDGYWLSKGITVAGLLVNDGVAEELGLPIPTTWSDIADPVYQGELFMSDPSVSGTMYAAVKGVLDLKGEDGWDFWSAANDNIPFYGKRGKDPEEKVTAGEFAVGIVPVDQNTFEAAENNGLTVVYPEDGVPWVPEGVAIFKNSNNPDAAKQFIEFMLVPENLETLTLIDGKDSAQAVLPGQIEALDLGLDPDDLIDQEISTYAEDRDQILSTWQEMTSDKETR